MITVKISNDGESTHVSFPCGETELSKKLEKIGAYGGQNAPRFYIEDVTEPMELADLKGRNINLDELNYFAKRLDGFVTKEKRQFYAAMKSEHSWDMKGLINLTFNLAHYMLIQATVYFPIWWGEAPRILSTFVESYDFSGKTIVPFCTSGGSGIGSSAKNLERLTSGATWLSGYRLDGGASRSSIVKWINGLGLDITAK